MYKYFPKSQIQTNLYTRGEEYVIASTKENYVGFYHKLSTGQTFSGKTSEDDFVVSIIPFVPKDILPEPYDYENQNFSLSDSKTSYINISSFDSYETISDVGLYHSLRPSRLKKLLPFYNPTLPTESDYKLGKFTRCFCKKSNELIYIEINKDTYTNLIKRNLEYLWQLYVPFEIPWQLTGNNQQVYDTNKNVTTLISQRLKLFNFNEYLKEDYLKYYQFTNASNLYTAGGEYKTANGKNYIGYYHIHDKTGPMVGATHIKEPHELLFPINTTSSYTPPSNNYSPPSIGRRGGGGGGY